MSNQSQRGEGAAQKLGGKIKKNIGAIIGDTDGGRSATKELEGETREEAAKAAERSKGAVEQVTGAIKNRVGQVIDNEQMAAEGKVRELKGETRQKVNR